MGFKGLVKAFTDAFELGCMGEVLIMIWESCHRKGLACLAGNNNRTAIQR